MINHPKTVEEFNALTKQGLVLVDFFATWCGPCRMLGEVIEEVDQDNIPGLSIVKVDVDVLGEVAQKFGINAVPALYLFKDGKLVNNTLGYLNKNKLLEFINK